jgi:lysophospholipase L1-like esterase
MDANDGSNKNRFTVVVDGGSPKTITTTQSASITLASGLAKGTHELLVWRNTEAGMGVTQWTGLSNFGTDGALLAPPVAPDRRIEVIGDSLSVGAGNEGNSTCTGGIDAYTNNYSAYGSVAARAVGADVVTIAWSGIGVYRNYDGGTNNVMPNRYPYAVPNEGSTWDFTKYQPHVVVINLGTNDFGSGDPGTAYETAYVSFVKTIRSKYGNTRFILIDMYGGNRLTRLNNVVSALKSGGESKIEIVSFSSTQNNLGCNQHPNVASHAAMGAVLTTRLRALMSW